MSWGERSCIYYGSGNCPNPEVSFNTCDVDCKFYESNGRTPDSGPLRITLPKKENGDTRMYKNPTKKQIKRLKKKGKLK